MKEFGFLKTDGENNFVKIYTGKDISEESIEILLSHQELKVIIDVLRHFEEEIKMFKESNKERKMGFTHLHLRDCGLVDDNLRSDVVFYVNLEY